MKVAPAAPLITLGTTYGGWTLLKTPALEGCVLVSCGLGEDASFDVEFAACFGARIRLVDPTPRAITHFEGIVAALGSPRTEPYRPGGRQPVTAYDLSAIQPSQLTLTRMAVSDQAGEARFFEPPNPDDVSYSLVNFQNDYARDTRHIVVRTIPIEELFADLADTSTVLKLDVEGAEIAAIARLVTTSIRPDQVLVEYDELSRPSRASRAKFSGAHESLLGVGYRPIYFDGRTCVSYVRSDLLNMSA